MSYQTRSKSPLAVQNETILKVHKQLAIQGIGDLSKEPTEALNILDTDTSLMGMEALWKLEGWELKETELINKRTGSRKVVKRLHCYGKHYPLVHPLWIHLRRYLLEPNPDDKYRHMRMAYHYLWPQYRNSWHFWTERRFREHCKDWTIITYAGGASAAKSRDAAVIAIIFWLADPTGTGVIVSSTTLESLQSRIWGYIIGLLSETAVPVEYVHKRTSPPKIVVNRDDERHGMFALAAKRGNQDTSISGWIGRHPKRRMLLVLDECTDMPMALLSAIPNLETGLEVFQCLGIGNSSSKFDLHGSLSTPAVGWDNIDPMHQVQWETTQKNGLCLFFSCYESPAILESNPEKRRVLEKFLLSRSALNEKIDKYGEENELFYRFVLGYWKDSSTDSVVVSVDFLQKFRVSDLAEWGGIKPLRFVAGFDPSFSGNGDSCIFRVAILGEDVYGKIVLDFRNTSMIHQLQILPALRVSADIQIAEQVKELCIKYNLTLNNVCMDASGMGRALGEVVRLHMNSMVPPIRIVATGGGRLPKSRAQQVEGNWGVLHIPAYDLWQAFKPFMQNGQIKGLDGQTIQQLTTRQVIIDPRGIAKLEGKMAYKSRMGAISSRFAISPDEADAASLALQCAIINYGFVPGARVGDRLEGADWYSVEYHLKQYYESKGLGQNGKPLDGVGDGRGFGGGLGSGIKASFLGNGLGGGGKLSR